MRVAIFFQILFFAGSQRCSPYIRALGTLFGSAWCSLQSVCTKVERARPIWERGGAFS